MTNPLTRIPARRSTLLLGLALAGVFVLYIFVRPPSLPASRSYTAASEQTEKDVPQTPPTSPTASPTGQRRTTTPPASSGPATPTPNPTPTTSADPSLTPPPTATPTPGPSGAADPSAPFGSPGDEPGLRLFTTPAPTPTAGSATTP